MMKERAQKRTITSSLRKRRLLKNEVKRGLNMEMRGKVGKGGNDESLYVTGYTRPQECDQLSDDDLNERQGGKGGKC
jgi:hypothetical protein